MRHAPPTPDLLLYTHGRVLQTTRMDGSASLSPYVPPYPQQRTTHTHKIAASILPLCPTHLRDPACHNRPDRENQPPGDDLNIDFENFGYPGREQAHTRLPMKGSVSKRHKDGVMSERIRWLQLSCPDGTAHSAQRTTSPEVQRVLS